MSLLGSDIPSAFAGIVVVVTALTYIVGSIARRDGGGARLWALAYLLMLIGVVAYTVWGVGGQRSVGTEWAAGLGNAATVGAVGCLLLGCRAFNNAAVEGPAFMVAALSLLTGAATVAGGAPDAEWAGASWLFLSLAGLFIGVVIHALAGRLRTSRASWAFAAAAGIQAAFSLARCVALFTVGTDSALFSEWFGLTANAIVTVSAGLVMAFCTFMLRAALSDAPRPLTSAEKPEVISSSVFRVELTGVLRRATERMEVVAVIAVRIEDVPAISIAFGADVVQRMTWSLRDSVRRFASPFALVGDGDEPTSMYVATLSASPADARRQAGLIYRGVVQAFVTDGGAVVPGIGVGVALSQTVGYDADVLCRAALAASAEAAASEEASVVFAPARGFAADSSERGSM